ncbi:unnamed protein product, partial [Urochloa humidicola]
TISLISELISDEAWGGGFRRQAAGARYSSTELLRAELTRWPHARPWSGAIAAALTGERRGSKSQRSELHGSKSRPASGRKEACGFAASAASSSGNGARFEQYGDWIRIIRYLYGSDLLLCCRQLQDCNAAMEHSGRAA